MFKHYFEGLQDIALYPIFSLVVFVLFFGAMAFFMWRSKKEYNDYMSNIPLK